MHQHCDPVAARLIREGVHLVMRVEPLVGSGRAGHHLGRRVACDPPIAHRQLKDQVQYPVRLSNGRRRQPFPAEVAYPPLDGRMPDIR